MNEELDLIASGLSPDLVQFRSQEMFEEYEEFKKSSMEKSGIEEYALTDDEEKTLFRSFLMHKMASFDMVLKELNKMMGMVITGMIDDMEVENGD